MAVDGLLKDFNDHVASGNGAAFAALFTEDGSYHDNFYGMFVGRDAIADMLENYFHRDASDFMWTFDDLVLGETATGEQILYFTYQFSFNSKLPGNEGKRIVFRGMSKLTLRDGLIAAYDEVFDQGHAMSQLNFSADRIAKRYARQVGKMKTDPAWAAHWEG